jgi:hypothetical protein
MVAVVPNSVRHVRGVVTGLAVLSTVIGIAPFSTGIDFLFTNKLIAVAPLHTAVAAANLASAAVQHQVIVEQRSLLRPRRSPQMGRVEDPRGRHV